MTANQGTFRLTRANLGDYDGSTIGWLIGDATMLAALDPSAQYVSDISLNELDDAVVTGYARGTIDVIIDPVGAFSYLTRDPGSSVPTTDTTSGTPAVVVFYDLTGADDTAHKLLAWNTPVGGTAAGFADWDIDPSSGIARIGDTAGPFAISDVTGLADALAAAGGSPVSAGFALGLVAVDGTETSFPVLTCSPGATGAGLIPDGFVEQVTLDLASFTGAIGFYYPDGVNVVLPGGPNFGVYFIDPALVDQPWVPVDWSLVEGPDWIGLPGTGSVDVLTAADIAFTGSGLTLDVGNVAVALNGFEGAGDGVRHVSTVLTDPINPDWLTGPVDDVDQPTGIDGVKVRKGDTVATLGDIDPLTGHRWIHIVHPTTGQWGYVFPSDVVPSGADVWTSSLSTNPLTGGNSFITAAGWVGVFRSYRMLDVEGGPVPLLNAADEPILRGGPSYFSYPEHQGRWVVTEPQSVTTVEIIAP